MDAELAALATTSATTLVKLMTTDAWSNAKALVLKAFTRGDDSSTEVVGHELDEAQRELSDSAQLASDSETAIAYWQTRLRRLATVEQNAEAVLAGLANDLRNLEGEASPTSRITMHANAQTGGKIYQQAHGVQNIF